MALASPGVLVKELDFTATVSVADQNIGVVAIDAERGPTDAVTYVASERELVEIFGRPNSNNFEAWFAASTVIQYGGVVAVIRPSGETDLGLKNANIKSNGTSATDLLIKNKDDYETKTSLPFMWAARTSGSFNNDVTVAVVDHGSDQKVTVTPAAGQLDTVDTVGAADASRTAGTYTIGASDYSAAGSGTGATFSIVVDGSGDATITITAKGSGYAVDDTITVSDANLGGGGGADLTFDAATVGAALPVAGTYFTWGSSGAKGNVYKTIGNDTLEVTLWDSTKRLTGTEALKDASNNTIATVTAVTSNDTYGELEYANGRKWLSIAPQPGTSVSVAERGGKFDEFHIVVVDTKGKVSGVPGTVLESLTYVSKASDAKTTEGSTKFWKTVTTNQSEYIYHGDELFVDTSTELLELLGHGAGFTQSNPNVSGNNALFKLFNFSGSSTNGDTLASGSDYDYSDASKRQAVVDGIVTGYNLVEDPEVFGDIDFLVPGTISASVVSRLIAIAEKRRDCVVVSSPPRSAVINSNSTSKKTDDVVEFFRGLTSTSYAMFDSGYKYIYDKYNDVYRYVPCAADVAGLCLSTTINSETWFSPAGYNRGQVLNATKLAYSPKQAERDRLYTNRINPITSFPGQGIVLFGDKTGLASPSAFDRINVRHLFIELEKNIANFSKYQLFEINDELTRAGFRSAVEPYLRGVQGRRGIYDFLVVCDTSNNTPDVIDRNELVAEIFIKPARSINFITITFVATRTGVSFSELIS